MDLIKDIPEYIKRSDSAFAERKEELLSLIKEDPFLKEYLPNTLKSLNKNLSRHISYYLAELVEQIGYLNDLYLELDDEDDNTEIQEDIFDFINTLEFAKQFSDNIDKLSFKENTKNILDTMINSVEALCNRLEGGNSNDFKVLELGEKHSFAKIVDLDEFDLTFFCNQTDFYNSKFNELSKALQIIKKHSPASFESLSYLTGFIVPLDEPGIVSYSSQFLPGISCINIFERDFIDLIDDLVHENSHHHLNMILNTNELIFEDDKDIFYSPWRRAFRPIRGLYHAVFTFFMGCKLFFDLTEAETNLDQAKLKSRFAEEYLMLIFCEKQILGAYNISLISDDGMELMKSLYNEIDKMKPLFKDIVSEGNFSQDFKDLNNHLNEISIKYEIPFDNPITQN